MSAPGDLRLVRRKHATQRFLEDVATAKRSLIAGLDAYAAAVVAHEEAIAGNPIAESDGPRDRVLLNREQAAKHLTIDPTTLDKYVARGEVAIIRFPGATGERDLIRFDRAALDAWIDSRNIPHRSAS